MCLKYILKKTKKISMEFILRRYSHDWNFPFYDPIHVIPLQFTWLETIPSCSFHLHGVLHSYLISTDIRRTYS